LKNHFYYHYCHYHVAAILWLLLLLCGVALAAHDISCLGQTCGTAWGTVVGKEKRVL